MASDGNRQLCHRFAKAGSCQIECKFLHTYMYCNDFQNGNRCKRRRCRYLHISTYQQQQYVELGLTTTAFWDEVRRTKQIVGVCKFYLSGNCKRRENCYMLHEDVEEIKLNPATCPVCLEEIFAGNLCVTSCCTYALCIQCMQRLSWEETEGVSANKLFQCPCCRLYCTGLILKT